MESSNDERWRELCKRITEEKDLDKMLELLQQLNQELDKRKEKQNLRQ